MYEMVEKKNQKQENKTEKKCKLKQGNGLMPNFGLEDVRVHYHSEKPKELGALAYTQGNDVYISPGREACLPHELWHVVQQKQGRVVPTCKKMGLSVNDNQSLEREADLMGEKAFHLWRNSPKGDMPKDNVGTTVQCKIELEDPTYYGRSVLGLENLLEHYKHRNRIDEVLNAIYTAERNKINTPLVYGRFSDDFFKQYQELIQKMKALNSEKDLSLVPGELGSIRKILKAITEREDKVMEEIAVGRELTLAERSCFIEPVLNDSLYGGIQTISSVMDIRKSVDGNFPQIPVVNPAHGQNAAMPSEIPRVVSYAQIKAMEVETEQERKSLDNMLRLAEDVTCWIKSRGRRIDSRTPDRKQSQNEKQAGALRSIHQNISHALLEQGESPMPGWTEWSSEIEANPSTKGQGNDKRFLEYTLWSHDRMVYDTVKMIAYFTEHYQFLNESYEAGGQNETGDYTKNPFFGIDMSRYI